MIKQKGNCMLITINIPDTLPYEKLHQRIRDIR